MLWPFNRFRNPGQPRSTIEAIYGMIVAQAREPVFYVSLNVPDTVNGRFDMLLLHLWIVMRQLRTHENGEDMGQALFDRFCADMDDNLREMGVGDLTVPKRMQKFGEAFYGRMAAYDAALDAGDTELAAAISRNILDGQHDAGASKIAAYVKEALAMLASKGQETLLARNWRFPAPVV